MKAVIVIDVDEEDIGREVNYISVKGGGMSYIIGAKDGPALIRPLPEEKNIQNVSINDFYDFGRAVGWNACIDEITGETE